VTGEQPEAGFEFERSPACADPVGLPLELRNGEQLLLRLARVEIGKGIRDGEKDRGSSDFAGDLVVPRPLRAVDADDLLLPADVDPARHQDHVAVVAHVRLMERGDEAEGVLVVARRKRGEIDPVEQRNRAVFAHRRPERFEAGRHALDRVVVVPVRSRRKGAAGDAEVEFPLEFEQPRVFDAAVGIVEHGPAEGVRHSRRILRVGTEPRGQRRAREVALPVLPPVTAHRVAEEDRVRQRLPRKLRLRPRAGGAEQHVQRVGIVRVGGQRRIQYHFLRPGRTRSRAEREPFFEFKHDDLFLLNEVILPGPFRWNGLL